MTRRRVETGRKAGMGSRELACAFCRKLDVRRFAETLDRVTEEEQELRLRPLPVTREALRRHRSEHVREQRPSYSTERSDARP